MLLDWRLWFALGAFFILFGAYLEGQTAYYKILGRATTRGKVWLSLTVGIVLITFSLLMILERGF